MTGLLAGFLDRLCEEERIALP